MYTVLLLRLAIQKTVALLLQLTSHLSAVLHSSKFVRIAVDCFIVIKWSMW